MVLIRTGGWYGQNVCMSVFFSVKQWLEFEEMKVFLCCLLFLYMTGLYSGIWYFIKFFDKGDNDNDND